ncbi:MAG: molecular chaperone HtpG [Deltaproteobacteria bacterium]|nr:molecular chaperone HtpG [Deltaproteobacteria bacterium]
MDGKKETHQFKTEVQQLLNLIVNSLYSNKEIFLRELISNASDAIDRLRFKAQLEPNILGDDTEFKIKITADGIKNTLTVSDNGIGMTHEEVMENIGTIAKSGTADFMAAMTHLDDQSTISPELIGQFGVGFYSAFIVAEKVTLISRAAGSESAVHWSSTGDGTYSIEEVAADARGTTVILDLKKREKDEPDFTDEWTIRQIIKRHSDFVNYPIVMDVEREEPIPENEQIKDEAGKPIGKTNRRVVREETLNSMKAIWAKDKQAVGADEYEEFYKHISHDWNAPLTHLHLKFEGTTEYNALLYIPSQAPFDLFNPDMKHGIHLYCKRVFIMENCRDLVPEYFRFIRGVVDAPDLNLNISREILQQDRLVRNIRRNLVKKIFEHLETMAPETYATFWSQFGQVLKSGIYTDLENRKKIADLARYRSTRSENELTSLTDYVGRMPPDQKDIYYLTGDDLTALIDSPLLERLKEKGYEVLLMSDPVDEWVVQALDEYDGKPLKSAEKGDIDLPQVDTEKRNAYAPLFGFIKSKLQDKVKDVKPSTRLKDSLACLSGDSHDPSAYMEKILKAAGRQMPQAKRVLELNPDHPALDYFRKLYEKDRDQPALTDYSELLLDMAVIGEGGKPENPARFSKLVAELMATALK